VSSTLMNHRGPGQDLFFMFLIVAQKAVMLVQAFEQ
jgi:hypothetical protein